MCITAQCTELNVTQLIGFDPLCVTPSLKNLTSHGTIMNLLGLRSYNIYQKPRENRNRERGFLNGHHNIWRICLSHCSPPSSIKRSEEVCSTRPRIEHLQSDTFPNQFFGTKLVLFFSPGSDTSILIRLTNIRKYKKGNLVIKLETFLCPQWSTHYLDLHMEPFWKQQAATCHFSRGSENFVILT